MYDISSLRVKECMYDLYEIYSWIQNHSPRSIASLDTNTFTQLELFLQLLKFHKRG